MIAGQAVTVAGCGGAREEVERSRKEAQEAAVRAAAHCEREKEAAARCCNAEKELERYSPRSFYLKAAASLPASCIPVKANQSLHRHVWLIRQNITQHKEDASTAWH